MAKQDEVALLKERIKQLERVNLAVHEAAPAMRHIMRCYREGALPVEMDIVMLRHVLEKAGLPVDPK